MVPNPLAKKQWNAEKQNDPLLQEDLPFPKALTMTVPTKNELIENWSSWFDEKSDTWFYLTITLVFDRNLIGLNRDFCEAEYRQRILTKFQRRIERNQNRWTNALPFAPDLFYYERDETSVYKRITQGSPHHIHGLLVIPKQRLYRIWSEDSSPRADTLKQDLASLNLLSDWLIEPLRESGLSPWLRYITKGGKGL